MALMRAIATPPGKPTKHVPMTPAEEADHLRSMAAIQAQMAKDAADREAVKDAAKARLEAAGFNLDLLDDIKKLIG